MVNGMPLAKLLLNVQVTDGQTPDVWQQQTQVKLKKVGEGVRSGMKTANAFNISCQMPALDRDRSRNVGSGLQSPATANRGLWRENNSLLTGDGKNGGCTEAPQHRHAGWMRCTVQWCVYLFVSDWRNITEFTPTITQENTCIKQGTNNLKQNPLHTCTHSSHKSAGFYFL